MKMRGLRPRLRQAYLQYAEDSRREPLSSRTEEADSGSPSIAGEGRRKS